MRPHNLQSRSAFGVCQMVLQQYTASATGSSSSLWVVPDVSSFACTTRSAVYLAAQSSVVCTRIRTRKRTKTARSGPKSSGSSSATSAANRAAAGAVGSCCRPFAYTTHAVYLAVLKKCAAGVCYVQKVSPKAANILIDDKSPTSGR